MFWQLKLQKNFYGNTLLKPQPQLFKVRFFFVAFSKKITEKFKKITSQKYTVYDQFLIYRNVLHETFDQLFQPKSAQTHKQFKIK